jgi:periplasmic divalent cation tolerance protein
MSDYMQITTTTKNKEHAMAIAEKLVKLRLAACAQVSGPVKSIFRWKDKVDRSDEWICTVKSKNNLYKKVEKTILEIHPYEVPEIIAVPIVNGSNEYLKWIDEECAGGK